MKTIITLLVALCITISGNIWLFFDANFWRECSDRWAKLSVLQTKEMTALNEHIDGKIDSDSLLVIHEITDNELQSFRLWMEDK